MLIHGVDLIERDDKVFEHQAKTGKTFEDESVTEWLKHCKHKNLLLDVGAYSGLYSILAAANGANVIAFEPNKEAFERLNENVDMNGVDVIAKNQAVGKDSGTGSLKVNGSRLTSGSRLIGGGDVEIITIDSLYLDRCDCMKIDVEGSELDVLMGAVGTIQQFRPTIIMEALDKQAFLQQSFFLCALGYTSKPADEFNYIWLP